MLKIIFLCNIVLISSCAWAQQEEASVIVTDRPDLTESSRTVPHKSVQLETGVVMLVEEATTTSEYKTTLYQFPALLVRFGLFKNIELRAFNQFVNQTSQNPLLTINERSTYGVDNLQLGTKINLRTAQGIWPEIAVLSHVVLPLGSAEFKNKKTLVNIILSLSHTLSNKFSLGYNVGWTSDGINKNGTGTYTAALGYALSNKFGCFFEGYGLLKNMQTPTIGFDGGLTYLLTRNMQIDISAGRGVTEKNYFLSAGYSVLFH